MKKIKITDETRLEIYPILQEILDEIKQNNEVFSHKVIEGLTLCLETIQTNSLALNRRNSFFKEYLEDLKIVLIEAIAMKQKRALYKKTKAENISDFFELSLGTLGQMYNHKEVDYFPFIKNKNTFETGVKEYNKELDEYLVDLKDKYSQSRKNIRL